MVHHLHQYQVFHYLEVGLKNCDIISIHCPYNSETKGLIDKNMLKACKKGSIIIIGNSQSVECIGEGVEYGSSLTQQVYVIDPINDLSSPKTLGDLIMTFK